VWKSSSKSEGFVRLRKVVWVDGLFRRLTSACSMACREATVEYWASNLDFGTFVKRFGPN